MPTENPPPPWRTNSAHVGLAERPWRVLWQARELIGHLALRDLRVRYRQTALGVSWVLLQPVISVGLFTVVFARLGDVDSQGLPYPLFALVGLVPWIYFSTGVLGASQSLVANVNLVTKVHFPRLAAPTAALVRPAVDFAVSLTLILVLAIFYRPSPGLQVLAAPLWLAFLAVTTLGPSLWLSALNVRYRDVQQAMAPLLQLGLLASPVAYPSSLLTGWQRWAYSLNPMVGVIDLGRWALLGAPWPGAPIVLSVGVATLLLLSGTLYFQRAQRLFADVI